MRNTVPFFLISLLQFSFLLTASNDVLAKGMFFAGQRIDSLILGYELQYSVYVPESYLTESGLPTIYFTDGQWYLDHGKAIEVLEQEIELGHIEPVVAVFVDSRDPANLANNRRHQEFMCNQRYLDFYLKELIPKISSTFPVSSDRKRRVIAGVSFGGLNAACFGLRASSVFAGIAMQSPASAKHVGLLDEEFKASSELPMTVFISAGTENDNTEAARKFRRTLVKKGHDVNYSEVPFGHDWSNWGPLIDDLLLTFFATGKTAL